MLLMPSLQLLDGRLDLLHTALLPHLHRRKVAVQTGTVPVARDGLGIERHLDGELLSYAVQQETGEPELVAHLDADAGADLELPLGGHDFGVGSRDLNAGVQAGAVVRFDNVAHDNLSGTDTAVVRTLRGGVACMLLVSGHRHG